MLRNWRFYLYLGLGIICLSLAWPIAVQAGGWAVLSVESLPTEVVADEPFIITFIVRQHGNHLIGGLDTKVTAFHPESGDYLTFDGVASSSEGYYTAEITLPHAGEWQWSINAFAGAHAMPPLMVATASLTTVPANSAGSLWIPKWWPMSALGLLGTVVALYAWSQNRMRLRLALVIVAAFLFILPLMWNSSESETAVAQQTAMPAIAPEAMGEALFVSKGCITCHQHDGVTITDTLGSIGPNLTRYNGSPDFLTTWLKNPAEFKPDTQMPNLELKQAEIDSLIAFLTQSDR